MTELIAFRAIQGLGAGGLIVLTQAVVGDVVPPRERGRYQGLFGAVFGVASVGGPLLGGVIVQAVSWRWIFYVNIPIGLVALAVLGATQRNRARREFGGNRLAVGVAADDRRRRRGTAPAGTVRTRGATRRRAGSAAEADP